MFLNLNKINKNKIAAWAVHGFTGSGAVLGFWAIMDISWEQQTPHPQPAGRSSDLMAIMAKNPNTAPDPVNPCTAQAAILFLLILLRLRNITIL